MAGLLASRAISLDPGGSVKTQPCPLSQPASPTPVIIPSCFCHRRKGPISPIFLRMPSAPFCNRGCHRAGRCNCSWRPPFCDDSFVLRSQALPGDLADQPVWSGWSTTLRAVGLHETFLGSQLPICTTFSWWLAGVADYDQ